MVMHARKPQRMNDGYFEKHQAHPYQNSKYSSSKSYGERYERIRDSPNGTYRSDNSPDSQSPRDRDRAYQSKSSYLQKIREKERENRDYKRDKYSDCARSPKEKRSREVQEHRDEKGILHPIKMSQNLARDRKPVHNNSVDKRDERERIARVGDWSEHVSSSGKKYYYNCKTEVSQWEKPREWLERERDRFRSRDRDRELERSYSRSSGTRHDKHSNSRSKDPSSSATTTTTTTTNRHWSSSSSRDDSDKDNRRRSQQQQHADDNNLQTTQQDMDISPGGDSTPTSEMSYSNSTLPTTNIQQQQHQVVASDGPVLLATALPRLVSQETAATSPVTTSNAPGPPLVVVGAASSGDKNCVLSVDTNHAGGGGEGPPTPTHSETPDCQKVVSLPVSSPPGAAGGGLPSSLQGMSSSLQALRPQGPSITPSLANHYRDDLVNHVRGWPAEILEKQAQKLAEEAHIMGSIQCSKVSAELKTARSIVRLTEIQATLQEQRILFLRQQIKELEELKSQNSFMSDDP